MSEFIAWPIEKAAASSTAYWVAYAEWSTQRLRDDLARWEFQVEFEARNPGLPNRGEWRILTGTRRASDSRGREAVMADAGREWFERETHTEYPLPNQRQLDEDDARLRYDDFDEGGSRGGRE